MSQAPSGTVTFLFTDVEGSTRLWEEQPEAMRAALARHDALVRAAVAAHGGTIVKTTGDGAHAAFADAADGPKSAMSASRELLAIGAQMPYEDLLDHILTSLRTATTERTP